MLFLTIPTANSHPILLSGIVENCGLPREQIVLVATKPDLDLPGGCIVVEDLGTPNIQRWWNKGIDESIRRGASAVAVLNDDLFINKNTLSTLHAELMRTGAAIACPTRSDWGPGLYKNLNVFPYTPVIWGCLWVLNVSSHIRPDSQYVWWYGDSDLDIKARIHYEGIATADVYFEHLYSGEGTGSSSSLTEQTQIDAGTFEIQYRDFLAQSRSTPPRRLFVQGQQFAGRLNEEPDFRTNFHRYVSKVGDPSRDRVVLVEPDSVLQPLLRDLWAGWLNAVIVSSIVTSHIDAGSDLNRVRAYKIAASGNRSSRVSNWKLDVHRFNPAAGTEECDLPVMTLQDLISEVLPGTQLEMLAIDLRVNTLEDASTINPSATELIATGAGSSWASTFEEARQLGLHFTGRPWGEARSSAAFSRSRSKLIRMWKSHAGELVEAAAALKRIQFRKISSRDPNARASLNRSANYDPFNSIPRAPVFPFDTNGLEALLRNVAGTSNKPLSIDREWFVEIDPDAIVQQRITECFKKHQVWPISMSIPLVNDLNPVPTELISPIIPGYPYSFTDHSTYSARYSDSYMAITHRKAGWDCFRHVEILGSGSTPLMVDVNEIPEFSMVHYPKDAFKRIMEEVSLQSGYPSWQFRIELRRFVEKHLTSKSMANYLLSVVQAPHDARVIFIDESLGSMPDYMSALTALGLKKVMGQRCVLSPEIEYLYSDTQVDTNLLYGRGFGYSRQLEPCTRSEVARIGKNTTFSKFDYVVIGNVSRNWETAIRVLETIDPSKVILIHGEDLPPTQDEYQAFTDSRAHIFVRSIH